MSRGRFYDENLYNSCSLANIIRVIKSEVWDGRGVSTYMGEKGCVLGLGGET